MTEVEQLCTSYAFNAAARDGDFKTLSKLRPEELSRDRGASFPTLLDILGHSLGGTESWLVRMPPVTGEAFAPFDRPEPKSLDDLRNHHTRTEAQVDRFFSRLTGEHLDQTFLVPKLPP
jgi:uncharacterized damage-inducible protein DinB